MFTIMLLHVAYATLHKHSIYIVCMFIIIMADMSSFEPRVDGAFGDNGLISLTQIHPVILSFEKPLLTKSLESIQLVLGWCMSS